MFSQNDEVSLLINEVLASQSQKSFSQPSQPFVYSQNSHSSHSPHSQDSDFKKELDEKSINTILAKSSVFSKVTKACEPPMPSNSVIPVLTPMKHSSTAQNLQNPPLKPQTDQLDMQLIKLGEILKSFEFSKQTEGLSLNELRKTVKANYEKLLILENKLTKGSENINNSKEEHIAFETIKVEFKTLKNFINNESEANKERYNHLIDMICELSMNIKISESDNDRDKYSECSKSKKNTKNTKIKNNHKTKDVKSKRNKNIKKGTDSERKDFKGSLKDIANVETKKNKNTDDKNSRVKEEHIRKFFDDNIDIDLTLHSDDVNDIKLKSQKDTKQNIEIKEINKSKINSFERKVLKKYKDKVKKRDELDVYSFIGSL